MSKELHYSKKFDKGLVASTGKQAITIYYHKGNVTKDTCLDEHQCNDCWISHIILEDAVFLLTGKYIKVDDKTLASQIFQVIEIESCREMYLQSPLYKINSINQFLDYYGFELI